MIRKEVTIVNKLGLHARAAARLVTLASEFRSDIQLIRGGRTVNGKSIMGVMMLAAAQGSRVEIVARGPDENEAVSRIESLIQKRFGEEE
ncbi:MAG TPA: HPr family phosphocarrier protein [Gammaproteobacteria bacterium]|nr:HPr family phosphocarrier protein [Gammaproteobacteria bacterium]